MRRARRGTLIAVDGINDRAILVSARDALAMIDRALRGGISRWDASGIFKELTMADLHAGAPSARTLLLLYAADLAFRLRWEIRPAVAEGRTVIAAPYVDTAVAFGRAAGLPAAWLASLFRFAPRPTERRIVEAAAARAMSDREGFVEFGCERWATAIGVKRQPIVARAAAHLRAVGKRRRPAGRHHERGFR
jgi:hypothetical protein